MDQLDFAILAELLKDAQSSFLQIANKLNISSFTVKNRYDKMVNAGVISGVIISIDLSRLGYQGKVSLLITNVPNQPKQATIKALKKIQNIIVISEILGPYDIIAVAPVTDFKNMKTLLNQVKQIPSVQRVNISFVSDTTFPISPTYGTILGRSSYEKATQPK